MLEMIVGVAVIVLALHESVPGRTWSTRALVGAVAGTALLWAATTFGAWQASPVTLSRHWWTIAAICAACSAITALPAVVLSAVLVAHAYPVRPHVAGALAGLGAGLMADAGWRPIADVRQGDLLVAHLGGVMLAASAGMVMTVQLVRRAYGYSPGYTPR